MLPPKTSDIGVRQYSTVELSNPTHIRLQLIARYIQTRGKTAKKGRIDRKKLTFRGKKTKREKSSKGKNVVSKDAIQSCSSSQMSEVWQVCLCQWGEACWWLSEDFYFSNSFNFYKRLWSHQKCLFMSMRRGWQVVDKRFFFAIFGQLELKFQWKIIQLWVSDIEKR